MWGPFLMCIIFGLFISSNIFIIFIDGTQFILLFFSVFVGGFIVTFNTRVLGGNISFFQSVSVLSYCLFPLFLAALALILMRFVQFFNRWVRLIVICVACIWSILCKN